MSAFSITNHLNTKNEAKQFPQSIQRDRRQLAGVNKFPCFKSQDF
jgi:hypothetical protein